MPVIPILAVIAVKSAVVAYFVRRYKAQVKELNHD